MVDIPSWGVHGGILEGTANLANAFLQHPLALAENRRQAAAAQRAQAGDARAQAAEARMANEFEFRRQQAMTDQERRKMLDQQALLDSFQDKARVLGAVPPEIFTNDQAFNTGIVDVLGNSPSVQPFAELGAKERTQKQEMDRKRLEIAEMHARAAELNAKRDPTANDPVVSNIQRIEKQYVPKPYTPGLLDASLPAETLKELHEAPRRQWLANRQAYIESMAAHSRWTLDAINARARELDALFGVNPAPTVTGAPDLGATGTGMPGVGMPGVAAPGAANPAAAFSSGAPVPKPGAVFSSGIPSPMDWNREQDAVLFQQHGITPGEKLVLDNLPSSDRANFIRILGAGNQQGIAEARLILQAVARQKHLQGQVVGERPDPFVAAADAAPFGF